MPPDRDRRLTALASIKEEILGSLEDDSEAEDQADAFFRTEDHILSAQVFDGSVHTECALLGILSDGGAKNSSPALRALFEYNGKPLGSLADIFQVSWLLSVNITVLISYSRDTLL